MIHSYPQVFALGHRAVENILEGDVHIQEKVDGSQFSFGSFGGQLEARSKGQQIDLEHPDKLFESGIIWLREMYTNNPGWLHEGWAYRCEYLGKPKHNVLKYDRVPNHHLALYDIDTGIENYAVPDFIKYESANIGLECVPTLFKGKVENLEQLNKLLDCMSFLGGCPVEGIVIKNYHKFGADKKVLMAKLVRADFKEKHAREWGEANPNRGDVIDKLVQELATEARWQKAVQHLKDNGQLLGEPKDIGLLIREVEADVLKEEGEYVKDRLLQYAWKQIARGITRGLPQWYKEQLAANAFSQSDSGSLAVTDREPAPAPPAP